MRSLRKRSRQKRGEAMTATVPNHSKVTYTSANVDWEAFHRQFDDALARIRAQLGRDYPLYIGREAVPWGGPPPLGASPASTGEAAPVGWPPPRTRYRGARRRSCPHRCPPQRARAS